LSDTHGKHSKIQGALPEEGDVLIHLGDVADRGNVNHIRSFVKWLSDVPSSYTHKIVISGNHDRDLQNPDKISLEHEYRDPSITFLDDKLVDIEGIRILGLSWNRPAKYTPSFVVQEASPHLPIHLLLTHQYSHETKTINENLNIPLHLFGHYHKRRGVAEAHAEHLKINCCTLPSMEPVIIDLEKNTGKVGLVHLTNPSYFAALHEPTLYSGVDF